MGYDAFISYSHGADLDLAPAVRDALQRLAKPWNRRRALSIFLDQASLEVSSELGSALDDRIQDTRWLVLFMSKESAQSKWVGEEIAEWAATKSKDRIALVLTSGEVVWDQAARDFDYEESTAVSEGMRGVYTGQESEPLFLDLSWTKTDVPDGEKSLDLTHARFKNDIATIAAPIHGMPKDELVGKDVREFKIAQRLRRAAVAGLAALTVAAVTFGVVARIQRNRSEARRLATEATANAAEQTDLALLLALQSLETTDTREGWRALRDALSQPVLARSPWATAVADLPGEAGQATAVNRVVFSPDGSLLASMGLEGRVDLWDPATERHLARLPGYEGYEDVGEAAFSPDGSVLATPASDSLIRLWDVPGRRQIGALEGHTGDVWDVAYSPDGKFLASASADGTIRLWDLEEDPPGRLDPVGKGGDPQVWEVAFQERADGLWLQWVSMDGSVRARPLAAESAVEELLTVRAEEWWGGTAPGAAFSGDGNLLAVGGADWTVQLWDLAADPPTVRRLPGHDGFVVDLAFSPDGSRLASAGQDRTLRLWHVASGEQLGGALTGHDAEVFGVGFGPKGELLASGSADRTVRLWDLDAGGGVGRQLRHGNWIEAVAVSPDGRYAAAAGRDSNISVWEVESGELRIGKPASHGVQQVNALEFAPGGELLASAGNDGMIRLWQVPSGLPAGGPIEIGFGMNDLEFSLDGKTLVAAGDDWNVWLWGLAGTEPPVGRALEGHEETVLTVAISDDGSMVASGGGDNMVRLWDVAKSEQPGDALGGHQTALRAVRFEPDGKHLLSASADGLVLRWDLATRQAREVMRAAAGWTAAAFNQDASMMAATGEDAAVRLWEMTSGAQVGETWLGHMATVEELAFSPDGSLVVSAGEEGIVRLWPPQSTWRELACEAVGRDLTAAEWVRFVDAGGSPRRQCEQG